MGFSSFVHPPLWFLLSPAGDASNSPSRMVIQLKPVICRQLLGWLLLFRHISLQHLCQPADFLYFKRRPLYLFCKHLHLLEVWKIEFIHTIPMGSSNIDVVTKGDVEDQRHNPDWFVNQKHMLRPNQEGEANKSGYFILKVPEFWRQPSTAFSLVGWQFGLHNRENLDNSGSEAIKLGIAVQHGLVGEKWDNFCDTIVDDPKAMLACYGLQNVVTNWTDEQIKHVLALDALFLATYIDWKIPSNERRLRPRNAFPYLFNANDVFYSSYKMWVDFMHHDLYQVENQIPFVLIDKVVEYISNSVATQTFEGNEPHIDDLQYQERIFEFAVKDAMKNFMATGSEAFKIDVQSSFFGEKTHILGAAYKTMCASNGMLMNRKSVKRSAYIRVPSATKLKQCGIKIVGVDGHCAQCLTRRIVYTFLR